LEPGGHGISSRPAQGRNKGDVETTKGARVKRRDLLRIKGNERRRGKLIRGFGRDYGRRAKKGEKL